MPNCVEFVFEHWDAPKRIGDLADHPALEYRAPFLKPRSPFQFGTNCNELPAKMVIPQFEEHFLFTRVVRVDGAARTAGLRSYKLQDPGSRFRSQVAQRPPTRHPKSALSWPMSVPVASREF